MILCDAGVLLCLVERYRTKTNLVLLDPDVAQAFPNDEAVNEATQTASSVTIVDIAPRRRYSGEFFDLKW